MLNVFYEMWRNGCLIRRRLSGKTEEKEILKSYAKKWSHGDLLSFTSSSPP